MTVGAATCGTQPILYKALLLIRLGCRTLSQTSYSRTLSCQVRLHLQQIAAHHNMRVLHQLTHLSAAGMVVADLLEVPKVIVSPAGAVGSFPGTLLNTPSAVTLTPQFPKWVPQPMGFLHRLANLSFWVFGNIFQYLMMGPAYNKVWYALPCLHSLLTP